MIKENLDKTQWADQALVDLIQQMSEQIQSVDTLTETATTIVTGLQQKVLQESASDNSQLTQEIDTALIALQHVTQQHRALLEQTFRQIQHRVHQVNTLYRITNQYGEKISIEQVLATALDSVWQKMTLRFAVIILGETELGPYTYHAMRGVPESSKFLKQNCPFPLWGLLARALLPRLNENEPDYLIIRDVGMENLPLPAEFPWMPQGGALMILPLRAEKRAQGAILLGAEKADPFNDLELRNDFLAIAQHLMRVLQLTQMQEELNARSGHLLSLQLFTKSIAGVRNYDKLVEMLVESICEAMGQVNVTIIFNQKTWHHGLDNTAIPTHIRNIIEWAMQAGQPIYYDPDDTDGSLEQFYYNDTGYALVVPILRNEQTQGAIQIVSKERDRRFEDGDMIVLRTIANCVAMILQELKH